MKKVEFNSFDLLVLVLFSTILILALTVFFASKEKVGTDNVRLKLKVTSSKDIYNEALKKDKVYFNSLEKPVSVVGVDKSSDGSLFITLSAPGAIENDRYIFNGARILIGRKAEIHSTYFAQGLIVDVTKGN